MSFAIDFIFLSAIFVIAFCAFLKVFEKLNIIECYLKGIKNYMVDKGNPYHIKNSVNVTRYGRSIFDLFRNDLEINDQDENKKD